MILAGLTLPRSSGKHRHLTSHFLITNTSFPRLLPPLLLPLLVLPRYPLALLYPLPRDRICQLAPSYFPRRDHQLRWTWFPKGLQWERLWDPCIGYEGEKLDFEAKEVEK